MAYATDRVLLFDRNLAPLPELAPSDVLSRTRVEEVNGEHGLTLVTPRRLQEGWRALTVDGTGRWREWVVTEPDEAHQSGEHAIGTYRMVWSLQYDLTYSYAHEKSEVGFGTATTSALAAQYVLAGCDLWTVGTCDAPAADPERGCVLIYESCWSRLSKVVETFGWEVDAEIEVSPLYGVVARRLCLRAHVGSTDATRRFDWGRDVASIRRTPDPGPYYCRVVPLGRGETEYAEDDETTFEWPLDITEETGTAENPGPYYIQDDEAAQAFRIPDGRGGWTYPTKVVTYDKDDPELLLKAAQADLHNHTRPGVTYEADVLQLAQAGMDVGGVSLGDDVQVVDRGFNPDAALRIQGRVVRVEVDELAPESGTQLTIGSLQDTFASTLNSLSSSIASVAKSVESLGTAAYVRDLLDRLNAEINATGGYSYLVEGEGLITYDEAVADPTIGSEAKQVTQIKGGSVRIASSRKSSFHGINDWDWKTVFQSGLIATEVLTASNIVTGIIEDAAHRRDPSKGNFWNLDSGELRMVATSVKVGNETLEDYVSGISGDVADRAASEAADALDQAEILKRLTGGYVTEGLYISGGHLYINASAIRTGYLSANYIQGGTLVMGGRNNVNGTIQVKNASGTVICKFDKDGADINGKITSNSGTIGGFTIGSSSLYNGRTNLTGGASGVLLSTSGISTGDGSSWFAISNGDLYGGYGSSEYGYMSFDHSFSGTTSGRGPRLAGSGGIALLCGSLVIGGYVSRNQNGTGKAGFTGTLSNVVRNLSASWSNHTINFSDGQSVTGLCRNLSITWNNTTLDFTKGICT